MAALGPIPLLFPAQALQSLPSPPLPLTNCLQVDSLEVSFLLLMTRGQAVWTGLCWVVVGGSRVYENLWPKAQETGEQIKGYKGILGSLEPLADNEKRVLAVKLVCGQADAPELSVYEHRPGVSWEQQVS